MLHFNRIHLRNWRQFAEIDLDLSKQVTILTGQNGSGKTTVLNILSRHFGWSLNFVSTPYWGTKKTEQIWSDILKAKNGTVSAESSEEREVGTIEYDDASICSVKTQTLVQAEYNLSFQNQKEVKGLHIPSHNPPAVYNRITEIPTNPASAQLIYQSFRSLLIQTYGPSGSGRNPGSEQKKSIISLAMFGYGNQVVQPNPEYRKTFEEFQSILRVMLPEELGFEKLEVRMPEVVLVTKSGDFTLDSMSSGINALFGMAWQIHMYGSTLEKCTVTIDEPENHLHPSMQRSLLPSLAKAFPGYRFIVATHSPFIVSSFADASVYGMFFSKENNVESQRLNLADLSGTPDSILRNILDVPSNLPIWVEDRIKRVIAQNQNVSPEEKATEVMKELREMGLADRVPEMSWEKDDAQS